MVDEYIKNLIEREPADSSIKYQFLDRMRLDCDYYLGGHRSANHLWANNEVDQIDNMKALWNSFSEEGKPQWLTMEMISQYENEMIAPKEMEKQESSVSGVNGRTIEVYVTNLYDYTTGKMNGTWVKLPCSQEEVKRVFHQIGINQEHNEFLISDYNTPFDNMTKAFGEYENLDDLNYLAVRMNQMDNDEWTKFSEIINSAIADGTTAGEYINLSMNLDVFELIPAENEYALGEYLCQGIELPEVAGIHLSMYIDYEQIGKDAAINFNLGYGDLNFVSQKEYMTDRFKEVPDEYKIVPDCDSVNKETKVKAEPERGEL
ncbi:MAG: LPD11 domain-containing protein [Wujia sp.]